MMARADFAGVLFGKAFLRFTGRESSLSAGTGTRKSDRSRRLVDATATASGSCISRHAQALPASALPSSGRYGAPRGPSPVRPPLCSPSTIGRPSDERFSARSPVPTERSFRQPNRQAHPERLAGPCAEPKRSLGRVFGDTARDSWRAASPLPSARSPSDGEVSQLAESSSFSPRSPFSCDSESVMRQRQGRSATSARPGG